MPYNKKTTNSQITLLVYDAILIEIWREEVLPHLLKTQPPHLLSPVMVYSVVRIRLPIKMDVYFPSPFHFMRRTRQQQQRNPFPGRGSTLIPFCPFAALSRGMHRYLAGAHSLSFRRLRSTRRFSRRSDRLLPPDPEQGHCVTGQRGPLRQQPYTETFGHWSTGSQYSHPLYWHYALFGRQL